MTASAKDPHIGLVVEGPGDAKSLPLLLRSWLQGRGDYRDLLGQPAICNGRDRAIVANGLERYIAAVVARPGCKAILVVLDSEGDPVCELGPDLLRRAKEATKLPIIICLAERNWEDWLYASSETLGLRDLVYSANSRGLSAIVQALRPGKYVKPTWQPRLTARMDITSASARNRSLARMLDHFDSLLANLPTIENESAEYADDVN